MTNPIGTATCNVTINVPRDVRAVLVRAAIAHGSKSLGEFLKRVIPAGLDTVNPDAAARVREIQRQYYGSLMLIVFCGALLCGQCTEARRVRTRVTEEIREEI